METIKIQEEVKPQSDIFALSYLLFDWKAQRCKVGLECVDENGVWAGRQRDIVLEGGIFNRFENALMNGDFRQKSLEASIVEFVSEAINVVPEKPIAQEEAPNGEQ